MTGLWVVVVVLLCSTSAVGWAQPSQGSSPFAESRVTRPDPTGTPTDVAIGVFVSDIVEIDDVEQSYTADLWITARWRDRRVGARAAERATRRVSANVVWTPTLVFANGRGTAPVVADELELDGDEVLSRRRVYVELSAPMDLRRFPDDRQSLPLRIVSGREQADELTLTVDDAATGAVDELSVVGWQLSVAEVRSAVFLHPASGLRFSEIRYPLAAARDPGFYRITMLAPLAFIVLMAWTSFWIDPGRLEAQVAITTASVFTIIAFRITLRSFLPPVAYMTKADYFVLGCTVLVFAALGHAVLTGRLVLRDRHARARQLDRWARWSYPTALLILVGFLAWT